MKRIRCPKCDESILFDETKYEAGRILVFECPECHKQFKIRVPQPQIPTDTEKEATMQEVVYGRLIVLENAFHFKQEILLYEGDNVVGRLVKGTNANAAIKTVDPSMDTTHCIVNVRIKPTGEPVITVRDAPSNTGTFLHNELLSPRERRMINDGDIITIGATTMILRVGDEKEE